MIEYLYLNIGGFCGGYTKFKIKYKEHRLIIENYPWFCETSNSTIYLSTF